MRTVFLTIALLSSSSLFASWKIKEISGNPGEKQKIVFENGHTIEDAAFDISEEARLFFDKDSQVIFFKSKDCHQCDRPYKLTLFNTRGKDFLEFPYPGMHYVETLGATIRYAYENGLFYYGNCLGKKQMIYFSWSRASKVENGKLVLPFQWDKQVVSAISLDKNKMLTVRNLDRRLLTKFTENNKCKKLKTLENIELR